MKMKKLFKMTMILLILLFGIQFQMNMSYAVPNSGAPEGAYTDSGSEQKNKEILEQQKANAAKKSTTSKGEAGELTYTNVDDWDPSKQEKIDTTGIDKVASIIVGAIRAIGILVSVGVLMIIGIKQMLASAEEKSVIKQAMPGYILGAILVFAITLIPTIIYNFISK